MAKPLTYYVKLSSTTHYELIALSEQEKLDLARALIEVAQENLRKTKVAQENLKKTK